MVPGTHFSTQDAWIRYSTDHLVERNIPLLPFSSIVAFCLTVSMLHFAKNSNVTLSLFREFRFGCCFSLAPYFIVNDIWETRKHTNVKWAQYLSFIFSPFSSIYNFEAIASPLEFHFSASKFRETISKVIIFCQWKSIVFVFSSYFSKSAGFVWSFQWYFFFFHPFTKMLLIFFAMWYRCLCTSTLRFICNVLSCLVHIRKVCSQNDDFAIYFSLFFSRTLCPCFDMSKRFHCYVILLSSSSNLLLFLLIW